MTQDQINREAVVERLAGKAERLEVLEGTIKELTLRMTQGDEGDTTRASAYLPTEEEVAEAEAMAPSIVYDYAILLNRVSKAAKDLEKLASTRAEKAAWTARDIMAEEGTQSLSRHGRTLYLKTERGIEPRYDDLLPEGIDESDPRYETTVAAAKASGKARLLKALKESELSDLVSEGYNASSLRSRLGGTNAELDENGDPIIPEAVGDVIEIKEWYRANVRK